jgi:sugar O-acyltransferase (sialic acid O-acetyltransferase NeuD family)
MTNNNIVLIGASGHAKVVIDIIQKSKNADIAFIIDDNPSLKGASLCGYPIIGGRSELAAQNAGKDGMNVIVAIGNNTIRQAMAVWAKNLGFSLLAAVHPSAQIGRGTLIAPGSVVMAGAVINADSIIGENVIVNTSASIDHDCRIGDGVHISPGCHICGGVTIGEGSLIGAGATIIPNIKIGRNVIVGAGSTVLDNVADGLTVVGSPAREIA